MYPLFCVECLDEGNVPEWGAPLTVANTRNIAATIIHEGDAYCARHYRELAGHGTYAYQERSCPTCPSPRPSTTS